MAPSKPQSPTRWRASAIETGRRRGGCSIVWLRTWVHQRRSPRRGAEARCDRPGREARGRVNASPSKMNSPADGVRLGGTDGVTEQPAVALVGLPKLLGGVLPLAVEHRLLAAHVHDVHGALCRVQSV